MSGATIDTSTSETVLRANALAAADTYIDNFRKGPGKVALVGVAPGTEVNVKLKNHAFNFGTNIHGVSDTGLIDPNPTPGSTAAKYQQFVTENFNMVEGSNAGKWSINEGTRDSRQPGLARQNLRFRRGPRHAGADARHGLGHATADLGHESA